MMKIVNLLTFIFSSTLFTASFSKRLKAAPLPFTDGNNDNYYVIELFKSPQYPNLLSTPLYVNGTKFDFIVDINTQINWLSTKAQESPDSSDTRIMKQCQVSSTSWTTNKVSTSTSLELTQFIFYNITNDISHITCPYSNTLGFANFFDNENFSIVDKISTSFIITNKDLEFLITLDNTKSKASHGEIQIGERKNLLLNHSDKVIELTIKKGDANKWWVVLDSIIIGDWTKFPKTGENEKEYLISTKDKRYRYVNTEILLDTIQKYIIASKEYMVVLYEKVFKHYINLKMCNQVKTSNYYGFTCTDDVFTTFPDFNFVFNNKAITFATERMFDQISTHSYLFVIISSDDYDDWTFGNYVFNYYDVWFNSVNGKVYFIAKGEKSWPVIRLNDADIKDEDGEDPLKNTEKVTKEDVIFVFIVGISVMGIIYLCIVAFNIKVN